MWSCVLAGMAQTYQFARVGHALLKEPCIAVTASFPTRARCAVCLSHHPRVRVRSTSSLCDTATLSALSCAGGGIGRRARLRA